MAFLVKYMGKTVVQIVLSMFGLFGGPILGLYTVGIHFPWPNAIVS